MARVLAALQQTSLEFTKGKRLLDFITANDWWRREIPDRSSHRSAWSIPKGSSVAWAIVAFLLTLVKSLSNSDDSESEGHAVSTLWLWLLCLVIGWLWVPTFTHDEVNPTIHCMKTGVHSAADRSVHPDTHQLVRKEINRNEFRFAPIFNYSRVMRYRVLVDDVWGALERAAREEHEVNLLIKRLSGRLSHRFLTGESSYR